MRQSKKLMDAAGMVWATTLSKEFVESTIRLAERMKNDAEVGARLASHECKACFYPRRVAGQAVTVRPCMSCGRDVTYSNTHTDCLCEECAKATGLCKHCGGDREMRFRRKWPKPVEGVA